MLSLPLSGIVPVCERGRGRERWRAREREREGGGGVGGGGVGGVGAEGNVRAKEERQGNKGMHADAGPISFTNMQILLPL